MSDLFPVTIKVPPELKGQVEHFVSRHPDQYFSASEFWIKAAREKLERITNMKGDIYVERGF